MALSNIHKGRKKQPPRILLYGIEGVGKSTFCANAPAPIFIPTEDGLDQIECDSFPLSTTFEEFQNNIDTLIKEDHEYKTVVIDSLDWLERLIWAYCCKINNVKTIERVDGGYGKGYVVATNFLSGIVDKLRQLREEKGMIIIFIAHSKVETLGDPEAGSIVRYSPRLHKLATGLICEWVDCVLFATREFGSQRGIKGGDRIIRTIGSASYVAKNRYGLPEIMPLKWGDFQEEIISGMREENNGNT